MNRTYSDCQNSVPKPDLRFRVWLFLCRMWKFRLSLHDGTRTSHIRWRKTMGPRAFAGKRVVPLPKPFKGGGSGLTL